MNEESLAMMPAILAERVRQDRKWGVQRHAPETWMLSLGEEFGETAEAILDWRWGKSDEAIKLELTQLAACCVAFLESLTRGDHLNSLVAGAEQAGHAPDTEVDSEPAQGAEGAENV